MVFGVRSFHCTHVRLRSRTMGLTCPRSHYDANHGNSIVSCRRVSIADTFSELKLQGKVGFIPYITAGDPDLSTTSAALRLLDGCGSDVIELGVPYRKPVMDGMVIQRSSAKALQRGADVDAIMVMLSKVAPGLSCPVVLLSYYQPILEYGVPRFLAAMKEAGARGLIVPDLSVDKAKTIRKEAMKNAIEMVFHTTPSTEATGMTAAANATQGFLYLTAHSGTTGVRPSLNPELQFVLQRLKNVLPVLFIRLGLHNLLQKFSRLDGPQQETSKPIAVGFGVSEPTHVRQLAAWGADGVIVGSTLVQRLGEAPSPTEGLRAMEAHARSLIAALP